MVSIKSEIRLPNVVLTGSVSTEVGPLSNQLDLRLHPLLSLSFINLSGDPKPELSASSYEHSTPRENYRPLRHARYLDMIASKISTKKF